MKTKVSNVILDQMQERLAAKEANKPRTCWTASATPCGKVTARIIIASMEPFTAAEAATAIHENLGNSVLPYLPTFTPLISEAHPNMIFASMHCYKDPHKVRPADETNMANCQAITASTYLDVNLGNVWERKEIGGKQYLIRANDDDLEEVMNIALTASVAQEVRVAADGFVVMPKAGDFITFFAAEQVDGGLKPYMDIAQVTEVAGDSVGIQIEEGEHKANAYLPASSVVNVLQLKGAALDGNISRADIINFLKECYGPEYAKALDSLK